MADPRIRATATTDARGIFDATIDAPPRPGRARLSAQVFVPGHGIGAENAEPGKECVIRLRAFTRLPLTLLDPQGNPIVGMKIFPRTFAATLRVTGGEISTGFFMRLPAETARNFAATTDAHGVATLNNLPEGVNVEIGFDDERFAYPGFNNRIALAEHDPLTPTAVLKLEPGATITGVVRYGPTGKPARDIDVLAEATHFVPVEGAATTDANGAYCIAHLPAGLFNVMLELDDLQNNWAAAAHEEVRIGPGMAIHGMDFTLVPGAVIKGKVITADTAEPVNGAAIEIHGPAQPASSAPVQIAWAGPDAEYSIHVPPGKQRIYLSGIPEAYRAARQETHDLTVEDGQTLRLDFRLQRRVGDPADGVVIGLDGRPAPDVTVVAHTEGGPFNDTRTKTNVNGRFHFDFVAPDTAIEVRLPDVASAEMIEFHHGQGEIRLQLVKRTRLPTLPGLVTDDDGKPIPAARIHLSEKIGKGFAGGAPLITDGKGHYQLGDLYLDTEYTLAVEADGFGEAQAPLDLKPETKALPTLTLPHATATTGGIVVDGSGKPLPGVTVHLNTRVSQPRTTVTDAQGRFSFPVAPGTSHQLWIATKEEGKLGPSAMGVAGVNDLKLVLPK